MPMGCRSRGAFGGRSKTYSDRAPHACSKATSGVAASSVSPVTPQEMALQDRVRPGERRKDGWDAGACKTAGGGDRGVTQLVGLLPDTAAHCQVVTHSRRITPLAAFWQHLVLLPLGAASGQRRRSSSRCLGPLPPPCVLTGGFRTDWGRRKAYCVGVRGAGAAALGGARGGLGSLPQRNEWTALTRGSPPDAPEGTVEALRRQNLIR